MSKKVALALGGGGVRGLAHIGVIEVLLEHGIEPSTIVGTSAGSIVGALYCDNPDIEYVKQKMLNIKRKDVMNFSLFNPVNLFNGLYSPMSLNKLGSFLKENLSTLEIKDFKKGYAAVATDMASHQPYVFDEGNVIDAVMSSTALPPVFSPYKYKDMTLVDGGITNPVPVEIARRYEHDVVIAVNINSPGVDKKRYSIIELSMHAFMTSYYCLAVEQSKNADFIIHPDLRKFNIFTDAYNQEIYEIGRMEALKQVPNILKDLGEG